MYLHFKVHAKKATKPDVRALSLKEMQTAHGSGPYRNAYFAGTLPWHRSLRDANLCNGNLFKSFTDIQVAPGRGAGLAMQRTYNSQDSWPGPFGVGWQQCCDVRMEEENPTTNGTSDSLNYVDRTDYIQGTEGTASCQTKVPFRILNAGLLKEQTPLKSEGFPYTPPVPDKHRSGAFLRQEIGSAAKFA